MKTLIVFFIVVVSVVAIAQPCFQWTRTYGGSGFEGCSSVQQTSDHGYIMVGWTTSFGVVDRDIYLVKTDSTGDTLWTRLFGDSTGRQMDASVQQTRDGGYIIAGMTCPAIVLNSCNFYLIKTDSQGYTQWTRTYGGTDYEWCYEVQQTFDGGYIMAGNTSSFGAVSGDFYLVKTDSVGDTLWTRTYGGTGRDWAASVKQTSDSGYIAAGQYNADSSPAHIFLVKTHPNGDTTWTRTISGPGGTNSSGLEVQQTSDGGYIVAGDAGNCYLVKTDPNGNTQWTNPFGISGSIAWSVQQTLDGGFIVAGNTVGSVPPPGDCILAKVASNGNLQWTRIFGGTQHDGAYSVRQTSDGGYIVAGGTHSFGVGNGDFYLVKTNPDSGGCVSIVSWGPPNWGYRFMNGGTEALSSLVFTNFCEGTVGSLSGNAATNWTMMPNGDGNNGDSIIFNASIPLVSSSIDTFWLSHPCCSHIVNWKAGDYFGTIEGPMSGQSSGSVTLISGGPPDWAYQLHQASGCLSRLAFTHFCPGTVGSLSGNAAASWTMMTNGDGNNGDSIIFNASVPLISGSIDTFWLSHPTCSYIIRWRAGDSSGTIEGPLPVELTSFEAIAGDGQVQIRWRTESETNNDHFVLYKRTSGAEEFGALTQVPGHGTTSTPNDYQYIDRSVVNGITYQYQISDVDINGSETMHDNLVSATPSAELAVPTEYALHQNYPNPFNSSTTIWFDIKESGQVSLKVFDLLGREVAILVNSNLSAGSHMISWDASGLASGIYLYKIEVGDFRAIRKLLLLK